MTAGGRSIPISQSADESHELAQSFDGEHRGDRRLLSAGRTISVGPGARHFQCGAISKTKGEIVFVGLENFEFLAEQGMVPPGHCDMQRQILKDILSM